jgi:hypothetical protein
MERQLAKMGAEIKVDVRANNAMFEVLRGALVSRMDIHQAKMEANHEVLMAIMQAGQEK